MDTKLKVIGSSSKGNGYMLECAEEILLIEIGCRQKDIVEAINFNAKNIVGVIVSHAHG
jgi:phosphoribosyl 1,2-cyclic phosphodiesterase